MKTKLTVSTTTDGRKSEDEKYSLAVTENRPFSPALQRRFLKKSTDRRRLRIRRNV